MAPAQEAVLSHQQPTGSAQPAQTGATSMPIADLGNVAANVAFPTLDRTQIMQLLTQIPGVFNKVIASDGSLKEDAAQTLSNLSQQASFAAAQNAVAGQVSAGGPHSGAVPGFPGIADPGPSSHPRGPPNLGQLSAVAMQASPAGAPAPTQTQTEDEGDGQDRADKPSGDSSPTSSSAAGGRRGARSGATMGTDEWTRQRKDNHKEVERRRRGNINEGINELGRIVPNGSGEKSKGAILSRAVQYIHHLKENEARNIEKWTLEKLLMDQAMGDLQAQLEEMRRVWEEERLARQRAESELEVLRGGGGAKGPGSGTKRPNEEGDKDDDGKRQRTE